MNIFSSSPCPIESARNLDDKRCIKMILESSQMLSTARPHLGLLRPAFVNHPATKWVAERQEHFDWLYSHLFALHCEYSYRYGKTHKLIDLLDFLAPSSITDLQPKWFVKLTRDGSRGLDYTHIPDVHESYREYLVGKWQSDKRPVFWTKRGAPSWL